MYLNKIFEFLKKISIIQFLLKFLSFVYDFLEFLNIFFYKQIS